jgi:hypothetical protein
MWSWSNGVYQAKRKVDPTQLLTINYGIRIRVSGKRYRPVSSAARESPSRPSWTSSNITSRWAPDALDQEIALAPPAPEVNPRSHQIVKLLSLIAGEL